MAIALKGHATSAASTTQSSTKSVTYTPISSSSWLFVVGAAISQDISKVTDNIDTAGTTWSRVAGPALHTTECSLWVKKGGLAGVTSITVTFAGSARNCVAVIEYSGVNAIGNVVNSATATSASPGTSVTTQDPNNVILCAMTDEGTATWSTRAGAGTLEASLAGAGSTTPGVGLSDISVSSPTANVSIGATISSSGVWACCAVELRSVSPISGSAGGQGSASSTLKGAGALAGAATGVASASAPLGGKGALAGSSAGKASASATLQGLFLISGNSSGKAIVIATLKGAGALAGASAGHSTATGTASGAGALSGASAGKANAGATISGTGEIAAAASGKSSASAALKGAGALAGAAAGHATASAAASGGSAPNLSGSISRVASTTATLTAVGAMAGAANGRANVSATLRGAGEIFGDVIGRAFLAAQLSGIAEMSGAADGHADLSGSLTVPLPPVKGTSVAARLRGWILGDPQRGTDAPARPKGEDASGKNH